MLGVTAAEILTSYWNSKHNIVAPPKVYVFNRRVHHGEIGALLAVLFVLKRNFNMSGNHCGNSDRYRNWAC